MSNDEIDEYKRLYSEYVSHLVNLHNYHHQFTKTVSKQAANAVRRHIKFMIKFERRMQVATLNAVRERLQNDIEAKANAKIQAKLNIIEEKKQIADVRAHKREVRLAKRFQQSNFPKISGRPKGSKNDNKTNKTTT